MADPLSLPKLPVNISEIVYPKERIRRAVELNKRPQDDNQNDKELRDACGQMESLFIQCHKLWFFNINRTIVFGDNSPESMLS